MSADKKSRRPRVFVWATGQDENIGDSLLRRGYIDALRPLGRMSVWVNDASPDFITGLGDVGPDETVADYNSWLRSAWAGAFRGGAVLALNAGEVPVSRRGAVRLAGLLPLVLATRARGGHAVWIGAGVPVQAPRLTFIYRAVARAASIASWRDKETHDRLRTGSVNPDWAFSLGTIDPKTFEREGRDRLALILRGDRPYPSDEWVSWVKRQAETLGLRPAVVVQVKRDLQTAEKLAAELGGDVIGWAPGVDHKTQELLVREFYRTTALAVGDRLHGLIVAATEGAVPVGWVESSRGKIGRHFNAVDLTWVGDHEGSPASALPDITEDQLVQWFAVTADKVAAADARLVGLTRVIAETAGVTGS